ALFLLSGTLLAQTPPPPQPGSGAPGQFNQAPSPVSEDHFSSNAGTWILIALGVGVVLWLCNKPKQPVPVPVLVRGPQPGAGCAVLIAAGVVFLAVTGVALPCLKVTGGGGVLPAISPSIGFKERTFKHGNHRLSPLATNTAPEKR